MKELEEGFYKWAPSMSTNPWGEVPVGKRFLIEIAFKYSNIQNVDKLLSAKSELNQLTSIVNKNAKELVDRKTDLQVTNYIYIYL